MLAENPANIKKRVKNSMLAEKPANIKKKNPREKQYVSRKTG